MMASRRLFRPHSRGDCVDCVNSPLAMRSSRVLACAGVAVARRGAVTRARALRARAEDPPCAHPAPSAVARAFATAWGRARRWTRAGTAEATGAASDIMAAPVLTSRKHSRGVVWTVATSSRVNTMYRWKALRWRSGIWPTDRAFRFFFVPLRQSSTRGEARDVTPGDARGSPTRRDTVASGSIAVSRFSHGARLGRDRQSGGGERGSPQGDDESGSSTSSQRRPTEHLRAVRHRREGGVDAGVEGCRAKAAERDARERIRHGEGHGRGSTKGGRR